MKTMLKSHIGRKKKYLTILLSYLIILVIPLICGAFLQIYNRTMVTDQAEEMTERMLTVIREQTDAYMENIWQMALVASQMDSIDRVLRTDPENRSEMAYELHRVGKDLQMFYNFDNSLKDVFVYFKDADKISGRQGVMDPDLYSHIFFDPGVTGDDLRRELADFRYKASVKMDNSKGEEDILCMMSDPQDARSETSRYVVVVVFEGKTLQQQLESIRWGDEIQVLIRDQSGQVICKTKNSSNEEYLMEIESLEDTKKRYQEIEVLDQTYAAMVEQSEKTRWKYYMLTPKEVIEENAVHMQKYYFLMLFGCIAVGFTVAGVLSRKHYHPVKILSELISQFKSHSAAEEGMKEDAVQGADSYQWLQEQMDHFFMERVGTMKILKQNKRELKNYYLLRLLENSYTADLDENLQKNQIIFAHHWYAAVQFIIAEKGTGTGEQVLIRFVVKNIFAELMEETGSFLIYMVQVGERIVGILNFDDKRQMELVRERIHRTQEVLEEKFHYEVTALLGDCYHSRSEIFKSYGDTCEMEEYASLLDDTLICYEDVCERDEKYRYHAELDQKLFNAVKAGNRDIAQEVIRVTLRQYFSREMSLGVYRCLMFDMLGTILRASDAGGYHRAAEECPVIGQLSAGCPINQMEGLFMELIEKVCTEIVRLQQDTGKDMEFGRKVQSYILENFRNPDINVSQTGQYFNMTPSYLSAMYKKQTGTSLLEYINQVRLNEAERLLEQGVSVVEVAERVGFRDSTYLIRVFKKKKGMTPGQRKQKL